MIRFQLLIKSIIFLLMSFHSVAQTSDVADVKNGLYYGKGGSFLLPHYYFLEVKENRAIVKNFIKFKGETWKILDEILKKNIGNGNQYINDEFILDQIAKKRGESEFILKCRFKGCKSKTKPVKLKYSSEMRQQFELFKNKDYIRYDFLVKMKGYFGTDDWDECEAQYENLKYKFGIYELAEDLTHKEYIIQFEEIKKKILHDIKQCQKER